MEGGDDGANAVAEEGDPSWMENEQFKLLWKEVDLVGQEMDGLKEEVVEVNQGIVGKQEEVSELKRKIDRILNETEETKNKGMTMTVLDVKNVEEGGGVDPIFIFAEEIWDIILSFVKDSKDARSCDKTCKLFRKLLRPTITTWRFDQVFPFVQRYLNRSEVLNCRPVCQAWNGGVDAQLERHICVRPFDEQSYNPKAPAVPPSLKTLGQCAYRFSNIWADLRDEDFLGSMRNHFRNPFIGRSVQICVWDVRDFGNADPFGLGVLPNFLYRPEDVAGLPVEEQQTLFWRGLYDFLQAFGGHIHHLQIDLNRREYDTVKAAQFLSSDVFRFCPELRSFRLKGRMILLPEAVEGVPYSEMISSTSTAARLNTLDLGTLWGAASPFLCGSEVIDPPHAYAEAILRKYCHQLKRVHLSWIAWTNQVSLALDWTSLTELHLTELTRNTDVSSLVNAWLPNLRKLGVKMLQYVAVCLDFAFVMKIVLGLSSTSKLHVLQLQGLFDEDELASAPATLFAPESLTSLEVEHRSPMKVVYNYLLRFPFLENLHLFWNTPGAFARACHDWVSQEDSSECEEDDVVELREFMFRGYGGSMYQSNVWRILPRLKVLSVQQQVYTRQGYDLYRKWEEEHPKKEEEAAEQDSPSSK